MHELIEIVIYLLAIMGIIVTTMSVFEVFSNRNLVMKNYYIFGKENNKEKYVQLILKTEGLEEEEIDSIIDKLKYANYEFLDEIVDKLEVEEK